MLSTSFSANGRARVRTSIGYGYRILAYEAERPSCISRFLLGTQRLVRGSRHRTVRQAHAVFAEVVACPAQLENDRAAFSESLGHRNMDQTRRIELETLEARLPMPGEPGARAIFLPARSRPDSWVLYRSARQAFPSTDCCPYGSLEVFSQKGLGRPFSTNTVPTTAIKRKKLIANIILYKIGL